VLAAITVAVGVCGCDSERSRSSRKTVTDQTPRIKPIDSLEEGELAEGEVVAFGLPLPRGMKVKAQFPDAVHANGRVAFEAVANYVRKRVTASRVDTGPSMTVFDGAVLKSDQSQRLRVDVLSRHGSVQLVVRDLNPRPGPPDPGGTDAERWKRMGLTPDGKPLPDQNE
jgi:hypothetical protein